LLFTPPADSTLFKNILGDSIKKIGRGKANVSQMKVTGRAIGLGKLKVNDSKTGRSD
jgi:hypothetical protein